MIELRALRSEDVEMLTEHLADDPAGAARISVAPSQWWELVAADPGRHGWIIEHHGEAVGYLDAEQDNERAVDQPAQDTGSGLPVVYLALLLFPAARGPRLAREVLHRALTLRELATAPVLLAYVEPNNHPARRTLLGAGFVENGTDPDGLIEHPPTRRPSPLVPTRRRTSVDKRSFPDDHGRPAFAHVAPVDNSRRESMTRNPAAVSSRR